MVGIQLDDQFDFSVNEAGDISIEQSELADIEKDLAVIVSSVLDRRAIGTVVDATAQLQLETLVATALLEHDDVDQVSDVSIQPGLDGDIRASIRAVVDGEIVETTV